MDRAERQIDIDRAERFVIEGLGQIEKQRRLIHELEVKVATRRAPKLS